MGLTVADLSAKLGLDTSVFDRGISGVPGKFGPISAASLGTGLVAGGALAGIGIAAVKMGAEFDAAYDTIRLGTGATGAKLDGLKDSFKQVVTDVPASFGDASAAISGLNQRLGVTGPRLRDLSSQFLNLSRITGTDVSENVRLGTRLFGDWSIKTKGQAGALDQLYRATQKSGIGLSDLMATVVQFGAPLRNMGFGFSDSIAMLAKWEKEGVNTSTVLTGMKFALKTFAAAGKEPQAALAAITAKIHDTKNAQAAMTLGMKTFGLRAGPDMVAAIREGRFQYQKFADTIANGKDTINAAAEDTADLGEAWTEFSNTLKVKAEPALVGLFTGLSNVMKHPFSRVTALWRDDVNGASQSVETMEGRLARLRAQLAKRFLMGDLENGPLLEKIADLDTKLSAFRALAKTPFSVGHLDTGGWVDGVLAAGRVLAAWKKTAKTPFAVGHLDTKDWTNGVLKADRMYGVWKALARTPFAVGHLNTGGWTDGIAEATRVYNAWKKTAQTPFAVGHVTGATIPHGDYSAGAADVGGAGYGWASALASNFGLSVSSTYRPGAITASGNVSDHGTFGRAADIAGPDSAMNRLWAYIKSTAGSWKQAIHEHQMLNYGALGSYGPSDHFDHVHLARMALGGAINGPAGGYPVIAHSRESVVAHSNPSLGLADLAKSGIIGTASRSGASFTFGNVSIVLPPGDYGDSEDAGSAAADAFMQRTREIARGY